MWLASQSCDLPAATPSPVLGVQSGHGRGRQCSISDGTYSGKLVLHVPNVNTDAGVKKVSVYFVWAFYLWDKLKVKTTSSLF